MKVKLDVKVNRYKGRGDKLNIKYVILFFVTLLVEIFIALFVRDNFIRPYVGDILVVVVIYFFIRSFIKKRLKYLPLGIFIFAVFVEFLQYINIVEILGLSDNRFMTIIIGTTFDFKDIMCYLVGCIILIIGEKVMDKREDCK